MNVARGLVSCAVARQVDSRAARKQPDQRRLAKQHDPAAAPLDQGGEADELQRIAITLLEVEQDRLVRGNRRHSRTCD